MKHGVAYVLGGALVAILVSQWQTGGAFAQRSPASTERNPSTMAPGTTPFTGDVVMRPVGEKNFDVAPSWLKRPTPNEVAAVFPAVAIRRGIDGSADIRCTLTVDGALSGCVVEKETPADAGFGAAARTLAPDLYLNPAQRGGKPVATTVSLQVTFAGTTDVSANSFIPGVVPLGGQTVLADVAWVRAPSHADVVAAYPAAARAANRGGRATLFCTFQADGTFRACDVNSEQPAGLGFGEAARALAMKFKGPTTRPSGESIDGIAVKVPFTFSERMLTPGGSALGRAALSALPSGADFGKAFPVQARRASMLTSDVLLDCSIADGGALSGCTVARETPTGYGFGEAALSLAPKFQVNPWSAEGLPVVGGKIRVPVKYQLKAG